MLPCSRRPERASLETCRDAGLHDGGMTAAIEGGEAIQNARQFFSCAPDPIMVDQEMIGNRIRLYLRNSFQSLQPLDDSVLRMTAVRPG